MRSVKELKNLKGAYVLMRADFNVPLLGTKVLDTIRIQAALPTIQLLRKKGARVVLISHIGRDPKETLKPVASYLKKHVPLKFVPELFGKKVDAALSVMKEGDVVLLENVRSDTREQEGEMSFARALAKYGDLYVNEAFPVSHREDASIVSIPKLLPAYAGLQFEKEIRELSKVLKPKRPFLFILGGAKAETKLPLLKRFLKEADTVFIGGILANDFIQAEGFSVGKSVTDKKIPSLKPLLKNEKLIVPLDVVVLRNGTRVEVAIDDVEKNDAIVDVGPASIALLEPVIKAAKLILWNGPMGWYEKGNTQGTEMLLSMLAKAKSETIIGGGDTSVLIERKKLADKFSFVSTGGGATLEYLAKGTLPGIKALK